MKAIMYPKECLSIISGLLVLLVTLSLKFSQVHAQTGGDPALVAYWKMEEGTGSKVVDAAGHGHDQQFYSAARSPQWSSDVPPVSETNGYSLDFGTSGGHTYSFEIPETANQQQLTVEAWVKWNTVGGTQTIASAFYSQLSSLWWLGSEGNELRIAVFDVPSYAWVCCTAPSWALTNGANLQPGQWYHVALVFDGTGTSNSDRLKAYINGVAFPLTFNPTRSIPTRLSSAQPVVELGYNPNGFGAPLDGKLDEVRIYTNARSSTDIVNDAAGQTTPTQPPPSPTPPPAPVPGDPVTYWKMEEGTGSTVVDSSGNGHDQQFYNATRSPQWSNDVPSLSGANGHSLSFDGGDDYSYSFEVPETAGRQELTVESWVKWNNIGGMQTIASAFYSQYSSHWWLGSDGNELRIIIFDVPSYAWVCCTAPSWASTVGADLRAGEWYHIAFVYKGASTSHRGKLTAYIDGRAVPVVFNDGRPVPTRLSSAQPVVELGSNPYGFGASLNGKLDEIRIYTVARSSTDIATDAAGQTALTSPPPSPTPVPSPVPGDPIAYWKMEEGTGSTLVDSAGNSHDQQFYNTARSPQWSSADRPALQETNDYSLDFDGADDYSYSFEIPESVGQQQLTVEAWVKMDRIGGTIAAASYDQYSTQWYFGVRDNSELDIIIFDVPNYAWVCCTAPSWATTVGADLKVGQWYHLAFVYDGIAASHRGRLTAYINGKARPVVFNDARPVPPRLSVAQPTVDLGANPRGFGGPLDGKLDELRIYTTARSSTDIGNDAEGQVAPTQSPPLPTPPPTPVPGDPIAYWKMEEGMGSTVVDSAGNNHDLQFADPPTSPTWVTDYPTLLGGNSFALGFDGAGDITSTSPFSETINRQQLTVESWVQWDSLGGTQTIVSAFQSNLASHWWLGSEGNELKMAIFDVPNFGWFCCTAPSLANTVGADLRAGQWNHIAMVFDGTGATHRARLTAYVNGRAVPVVFNDARPIPTGLSSAQALVEVGYSPSGFGGSLSGKLDEVRIYTTARSSTDIANDAAGHVAYPVNAVPSVDAGGPYEVHEGATIQVSSTGSDPENGPLTYAWDLDNNGSFETAGQNATFSAIGLVGPSNRTITVQVTDNGGLTATDTATVNILPVLRIITGSPLPAGYVGVPYSVILEATGGVIPYTWSISGGALPPGLSLNATSGEISGVPTTAGTFGFTVQVEDSSGLVITRQFSLQPPPPAGSAGTGYQAQINVVDVPPDAPPPEGGQPPACSNYQLVSGTLPDGVTLDPETGIISGVPLDGGTYNFTVECVITNQTVSKDFTITIYNPLPTITQLVPDQTREDTGDFTLTVIGTNFVQSSVVQWNESSRATTFVSTTELRAAIANSDIATPGTASVTVINPEPNGGTSNAVDFTILPNSPPEVEAGGPYTVDEGNSVEVVASGTDPDGDPISYEWDLDNDGIFEIDGATAAFSAAQLDGPGSYTIIAKATDSFGLFATEATTVVVNNVAPTVGPITAPINPIQVNTPINASSEFTDPGILDTHTAVWDWGDNSTSAGTVSESNGSGSATGSHSYPSPGVYTVKVTVTDDDGGAGEAIFQYIVIYDPNGGFVTGGGWINSPVGAYSPDPTLTGKATFGFVSKYQKGATVPTGNTEFQFHVANMNFKSTSYDWLVIAGAKAQYKGTGTINGAGEYKFLLTAIDGSPDKFRIKIWDKVTDEIIYDNMLGAPDSANPTTALGGGSIVIHK